MGQLDPATVLKLSEAILGEIVPDRLFARSLALAVEHAGAGRGLFVLVSGGAPLVVAAVGDVELPASIFEQVTRSHERVVAGSALCLPLIEQGALIGVLYLESLPPSRGFTPDRITIAELIVSLAAIALDHARRTTDLQDRSVLHEEAQRLSHTGSFGWNPTTGETVLSPETYEILGFDRAQQVPRDLVATRIHPDDRAAALAGIDAAARAHRDWESKHRLLLPDGTIRHIHVVARAVSGRADGIAYVGAIMDVTAARHAEEAMRLGEQARALAQANERLRLALIGSNIAIWDFDLRGRDGVDDAPVYTVNRWERLGYEPDAVSGGIEFARWHPERYHAEDEQRVRKAIAAHIAGENPVLQVEARARHRDGHYVWGMLRGKVVRDAAGKAVRLIGTNVDISDRKELEDELRRAKEVAEAANRTKDRFMANVSHEIRTPMNAILGMTELALDSQLSEEQRQSFATVKTAAEDLLVIIDDLLDFSKIEAGKLALLPAGFSLRGLVRDILRTLAIRAHRKGLELIGDVDPEVGDDVVGDAVRLRQVLLNIVGNAVKFTERGEVAVKVEPAGAGRLHFSVRDTGIGIASEQQEIVFAAFEQAEASTTRRHGGTGLGLTIAARLVELMGGRIDVTSAPGRGSTFSFTAEITAEPGAEQVLRSLQVPLDGLRLLVVDDSCAGRELLGRWLMRWGVSFTSVADGEEALAALRDAVGAGRPYSAVLLDAQMPGLDGLAVITHLRADPALAATRVVLLGSSERSATLERLRALGGATHLPKPLMPEDLWAAVRAVAEGRPAGRLGDSAPAPAVRAATRPLRILVAEDNELNEILMRRLLGKRGHDVTVANDGRAALALLEAAAFDVLLLDIHLPELDGFDVIARIRRRELGTERHLHVIATTARSRREDREACLAAGMDDFLSKPIASNDLWSALDRVTVTPRSG